MTVPAERLVTLATAVLLPAAGAWAFAPEAAPLLLAIVAALAAVAAVDARRGRAALARFSASLEPIVRLTERRAGRLALTLHDPLARGATLRVGLSLPPELGCEEPELTVALPPGSERSRVEMALLPSARGRFAVARTHLQLASPLGLWEARAAVPTPAEVRVHPDLLAERRGAAALFLNRGGAGVHARRQVGRGREFEKLRDYVPGDDTGEIHWKATARRARPVTKVFRVERTQEVYAVLDASRLTARLSPDGTPLFERFLRAALLLGVAAERQGDLFGLACFSDGVEAFLPARGGKAHFRACRDALTARQPRPVSPDFEELFVFLRKRLRRRALLVFLTDLEDPVVAEAFASAAPLLSRQHLVLAHVFPPPEALPLFTGPAPEELDAVYARLGGHLNWQRLRQLGKTLAHRGVTLSFLSHETAVAQVVSSYAAVKSRQAL